MRSPTARLAKLEAHHAGLPAPLSLGEVDAAVARMEGEGGDPATFRRFLQAVDPCVGRVALRWCPADLDL